MTTIVCVSLCKQIFLSLLCQLRDDGLRIGAKMSYSFDVVHRHSLIGYCSCLNFPGLVTANQSAPGISVELRYQ